MRAIVTRSGDHEHNGRGPVTGPSFAVDIGGTFTDVVCISEDGRMSARKVLSSPDQYGEAVVEVIGELQNALQTDAVLSGTLLHATTVATNAVIQRNGAKTGFITTDGFRDTLEFGRMRRPVLYDLDWEKPEPLIPRRWRRTVTERMAANSEVLKPLRIDELENEMQFLRDEGVTSIALGFLNSYANPEHEVLAARWIKEHYPDLYLSISNELAGEIREVERFSTAAVDAYVKPVVHHYLQYLIDQLSGIKIYVMQSNGGLMDADVAVEQPVQMLESGPAAGVVASEYVARQRRDSHVLTFDMGGTTVKSSIIEDGQAARAAEFDVGGSASGTARVFSGTGYVIRVPVIDVVEVGAGGGSIARVDMGGSLLVGPGSAGADPGPACYGLGGNEATVTDANVVLGYVNVDLLRRENLTPDAALAHSVIKSTIADPLGLDVEEAAFAIHRIANFNMVGALRAVSTERGKDIRDFTLYAFGGSGPVHASHLASEIGARSVVIPPVPGLFSALGLLVADTKHYFVRSLVHPLLKLSVSRLLSLFAAMETGAVDILTRQGVLQGAVFSRSADLRYQGQRSELNVPVPGNFRTMDDVVALIEVFHRRHDETYGHHGESERVELVTLRLEALAPRDALSLGLAELTMPEFKPSTPERDVYLYDKRVFARVPVLSRVDCAQPRTAPLVVESYDSTVVVSSGTVVLDEFGNLEIRLSPTLSSSDL